MSSRAGRRFLGAAATVLLAAGTALVVSLLMREHPHGHDHDHGSHPHHRASEDDFHRWMHEQLTLSDAQEKALHPIEVIFETDRERLRAEIAEAGRELADAVRGGKADSPEIDAALSRLSAAQAKLQRVTLDHFFAMKDHLDPAQAEKLLQWTHDSILPD